MFCILAVSCALLFVFCGVLDRGRWCADDFRKSNQIAGNASQHEGPILDVTHQSVAIQGIAFYVQNLAGAKTPKQIEESRERHRIVEAILWPACGDNLM